MSITWFSCGSVSYLKGKKKRLPSVRGNLCCSRSHASKVTLMLLRLEGAQTYSPLQEVKIKVCLSSYIGEAEFDWCYLVLAGYYILRLCLRSRCVVFVTGKTKVVPVLKTPLSCIGFSQSWFPQIYHVYTLQLFFINMKNSHLFKWNLWLSSLEIWLRY